MEADSVVPLPLPLGVPAASSVFNPPDDEPRSVFNPPEDDPRMVCPPANDTPKRERPDDDLENKCAFCHEGEDSDDPDEDPLVEVNAGRSKPTFAHDQCLWWCPDITQAEDLSWMNVGSALRRCARLKCAVCGETHAPLGCKRKACRKNWHYPCAMEPTTGLVIYEDEFCVACPICHEVMQRRERKKAMLAEEKKKAKEASKAAAASAKAAAAASKKAAVASSAALPATTADARANQPAKAKAVKGGKAPVASSAAPPPKSSSSASSSSGGKGKAAQAGAPSVAPPPQASSVPSAPPPPPLPPPPPPPDPRLVAAELAIADLFKSERKEDLPLEMVQKASGLPNDDLDVLLKKMDDENKLLCRQGTVYLI